MVGENQIKDFAEIDKKEPLYNDAMQINVKDLIKNKDVVTFEDVEFLPSKFGEDKEFAICLVKINGQKATTTIGSGVIVDQLKRNKEQMPFKAKIEEKSGNEGRTYMTLGSAA